MLFREKLLLSINLSIFCLMKVGVGGGVLIIIGGVKGGGGGTASECRDILEGIQISLYISSAILWCSRGDSFFLWCCEVKGARVCPVIMPIRTFLFMCKYV